MTIECLETVSNSLVMAGEFTTFRVVRHSYHLYANQTVSYKKKIIYHIFILLDCNCLACASEDGEICLDSATTVPPAPLVSPGGISAIVIVVIIVIAVLSK